MPSAIFLLISLTITFGAVSAAETRINIDVAAGSTAVLPCKISNRDDLAVAWTDQTQALLTFRTTRVSMDWRLQVDHPSADEWNLHIHEVRQSDQGVYTCMGNTYPLTKHSVVLSVHGFLPEVPPNITSPEKDGEVSVREFEDVRLTCKATGIPEPTITWFKLPSQMCEKLERVGEIGEVLILHNVSRHFRGRYQCKASNTVSPYATRDWNLQVEFEPDVSLINGSLISQPVDHDTVLECHIAGHPQPNVSWSFNQRQLGSSKKHKLEVLKTNSTHQTLNLHIRNIQLRDFGNYTCTAINALGRAQKTMTLRCKRPTQSGISQILEEFFRKLSLPDCEASDAWWCPANAARFFQNLWPFW